MYHDREELEKLKKAKQSAASEGAKQITALKNKNNELQTALGNSEHDSSAARLKAVSANTALGEAQKRLSTLEATVSARADGVRGNELTLSAVEREVAELEGEVAERQKRM